MSEPCVEHVWMEERRLVNAAGDTYAFVSGCEHCNAFELIPAEGVQYLNGSLQDDFMFELWRHSLEV